MNRPAALPCLVALAALLLAADGHAATEQRVLGQVGVDQKPGTLIPTALHFTDRQGRSVTLGELIDGKPTLLELAWYGCPNLCDLSLRRLGSQLSDVKYTPGQDYQLITVSIDPHESAEQAARAERMLDESYRSGSGGGSGDGRWHVLTGNGEAIRSLATALGFRYRYHPESGQFAHPAGLAVLTGEGRISSYLLGLTFSGHDLQRALTRAAQGGLGSITDQIVLRCFHFDSEKGVYTLDILRLLRIACALTAVLLALLVGGLSWRRRHGAAKRWRG